MEQVDFVLVTDFCKSHEVSYTFISSLKEAGLVEVISEQEQDYLRTEQLRDLEKMVRLYSELDINIEGIEAIAHLLQRLDDMQQELRVLKQRLQLYEGR